MSRYVTAICLVAGLCAGVRAANANGKPELQIYFLDMAGGASTLIVTPLGESVLIDTGSLRPMHRDVDRICRACTDAGVEHIDHLITTHFHLDHYGGILELTKRIAIGSFWDKGALPPAHEQDSESFRELYPQYLQATRGGARPIRAGDDVPLRNDPAGKLPHLRLHCVAAEKKVEGFEGDIDAPVDGFQLRKADDTDNARSIALVLTCGDFTFFAGGDITWNVEHHLTQPVNRIGDVDLYQVTHHGLDQSNNTLLLQRLRPTVCVAMNGPRKGIQPRTFKDIMALPGLRALYQIHYNTGYGKEGNTQRRFIANPQTDPDKGEFIKAVVQPDNSTFTVQIGPAGQERVYPIR